MRRRVIHHPAGRRLLLYKLNIYAPPPPPPQKDKCQELFQHFQFTYLHAQHNAHASCTTYIARNRILGQTIQILDRANLNLILTI
jgi:hypothetical protein